MKRSIILGIRGGGRTAPRTLRTAPRLSTGGSSRTSPLHRQIIIRRHLQGRQCSSSCTSTTWTPGSQSPGRRRRRPLLRTLFRHPPAAAGAGLATARSTTTFCAPACHRRRPSVGANCRSASSHLLLLLLVRRRHRRHRRRLRRIRRHLRPQSPHRPHAPLRRRHRRRRRRGLHHRRSPHQFHQRLPAPHLLPCHRLAPPRRLKPRARWRSLRLCAS